MLVQSDKDFEQLKEKFAISATTAANGPVLNSESHSSRKASTDGVGVGVNQHGSYNGGNNIVNHTTSFKPVF